MAARLNRFVCVRLSLLGRGSYRRPCSKSDLFQVGPKQG
jgi:hypothetical protein